MRIWQGIAMERAVFDLLKNSTKRCTTTRTIARETGIEEDIVEKICRNHEGIRAGSESEIDGSATMWKIKEGFVRPTQECVETIIGGLRQHGYGQDVITAVRKLYLKEVRK